MISIEPGEQRVVFRGNGAETGISNPSLAIVATQEESSDDGGSQSALGVLDIGRERLAQVEFDVKDGVLLSVPAVPFTVSVRNLNEPDQPNLRVQVYYVHGTASAHNTRTYDIGFAMDDPNIRVPAFAESFIFDLGLPEQQDYAARLSDSASGETYGFARPGEHYLLNRRIRWVRFGDIPEGSMGTLTFVLSV
ncbi:MAG: hypothetical protein ACRDS1_16050 [Pseudonocardiaceae bacterium]